MAIRLATTVDLADLVRLNDQIQLQHAEQYPHEFKYPADTEGVSNFFADLISSDTDVVIVACDEQSLYAYLWYAIHRIQKMPSDMPSRDITFSMYWSTPQYVVLAPLPRYFNGSRTKRKPMV